MSADPQLNDARAVAAPLPTITPEMQQAARSRLSAMALAVRFGICDPTAHDDDGYLLHACFRMVSVGDWHAGQRRCLRHRSSRVVNPHPTR